MKRRRAVVFTSSVRGSGSLWKPERAPQEGQGPQRTQPVSFFSPSFSLRWSSRTLSRAECPGSGRSRGAAVPGPPASGRRSAEGPGSSGSGALPSGPGRSSEGGAPWMRRTTGRNSGDLGGSKSLYSAAPPPALRPSGLGPALWMDTDVRIIH